MVNVEYINPFVGATLQAVEITANLRPTRGKPFLRSERTTQGDITGIISLSGPTQGTIALTFPGSLALKLYAQMVGEEVSELSEDVRDAVGEIANMVAGGAKAVLSQRGSTFKISIPEIVMGKGHPIPHVGSGPALVVPFQLGNETFWLEVSFQPEKKP